MSKAQVTTIYTLLGKHGLRDEKENIVKSFSANRTKSVSALTNAEAAALIGHLKSLDPTDKAGDKMRNKILSYAHEMRWHKPGTDRVDMDHVNNWCMTYGHVKKKLDDYKYNELPKLVSQFEEVYKAFIKKPI